MSYQKSGVPGDVESLPFYLEAELEKISIALNQTTLYKSEQFNSKDSGVNKVQKREGVQLWDSTSKKPVWSTGNSPEDTWIFGDGTVAYSPS